MNLTLKSEFIPFWSSFLQYADWLLQYDTVVWFWVSIFKISISVAKRKISYIDNVLLQYDTEFFFAQY